MPHRFRTWVCPSAVWGKPSLHTMKSFLAYLGSLIMKQILSFLVLKIFVQVYAYWITNQKHYQMKKKQNKNEENFLYVHSLSTWPFFKIANSQNLFVKILWIGPLVIRIDWREGHWLSSTYMAVRLSDIRAKTGKKCIFCVFRLFLPLCQTASWPYRLS